MDTILKQTLQKNNTELFSNKALRQLIIPLVIEQLLVILVGVADTMMVSYAGEAAMSGVSLIDIYAYMIITIMAAVSTGGAVIVSQYLGNKDNKNANLSASQLMTISLLISMALMIISMILHKGILNLFFGSVEPDVMQAADKYLLITAVSFPFLGIYDSGAALYRSMEKTKTTMCVSLLMNIINIAGNAVGIFVLKAGVVGVAVPTLISRIVAGIIMTALVFRKSNAVYISIKEVFSYKRSYIKRILSIAVPNGIENGLFALGRILVLSITALFGTTQLAANSAALSISQIAILVVNAINLAMVTVVGQCVGAEDYFQASMYMKKLIKISYISTFILSTMVCSALPFILRLYKLSDEAYHLAFILVFIHNIAAIILHPLSFNLPNGLRAAGDAKYTMYVGIGSMILFRLGVAVLFGIVLKFGVIGVFIAMVADWTARSVLFVIRYISGKWKNYRAI